MRRHDDARRGARAIDLLRHARKGAGDVIDPEPDDEAALCAYLGLGLTIVRVVDDDLRVFRLEPGRAALEVRLEPGDLGVEANDFRAPRSECHHRADAGDVVVAHSASTASATASPPPRQSDTIPRRLPRA